MHACCLALPLPRDPGSIPPYGPLPPHSTCPPHPHPHPHPAGAYEEVAEGDFLEAVTQAERAVCHFYHRDFERCRIMDKHLALLAPKHFDTRFVKLSAPVRLLRGRRVGWAWRGQQQSCWRPTPPSLTHVFQH